MTGPSVEIPQYRCHKIVRAAKITGFRENGNPDMPDILLGEIGGVTSMLPEWHQKHKPEVGGYYVVYEDGYASYSPAKAFEDGYTRVPQDFKGRVRQEYDELNEKLSKLVAFFGTPTFEALSQQERSTIQAQHAAMCDYSNCLSERIDSF